MDAEEEYDRPALPVSGPTRKMPKQATAMNK